MTAAFRPEPEAAAELEDAALWYERQRSGLGVAFIEAVDLTLERIGRWPKSGRTINGVPVDIPARRMPVNRFPYHVAYMEWEGVIRILAVAHDSRVPGYWLGRAKR